MDSSSASRVLVPLDKDQLEQLSALCIVLGATNEACRIRDDITYASGDTSKDKSLTDDFLKFLCKLAQICDTQKGGSTVTALVCLKGARGPEYLFTSNHRKLSDLEEIKTWLSGLLRYAATNPEDLNPKPLQKQILWRILECSFNKLDVYLRTFASELDNCIHNCETRGDAPDSVVVKQLRLFKEKANFPRDMTSMENAKNKFLRDCETLFKAVQVSKDGSFDTIVASRAGGRDATVAYSWCQLRHYLGRLHSYRQASEIIAAAPTNWPELFRDFTVNFIPSALPRRFPSPKSLDLSKILSIAFPDLDPAEYESDITELKKHGLEETMREKLRGGVMKAMVHGEINLHDHLVQHGKTRASDFWNGSMFIASSKPTCRLCHYYFDSPGNDFRVQSTHMNLYPKWRLPDVYEDQGERAQRDREEMMEDIIEQMHDDTLRTLKEKLPDFRRNDSRTDSHAGSSVVPGMMRAGSSSTGNYEHVSGMRNMNLRERVTPSHLYPPVEEEDDEDEGEWHGIEADEAYSMNGTGTNGTVRIGEAQ